MFAFTAETDDCSEGTGVGVTTVTETLAFGPVEEGGHCNATSSPVHFQNLDIVYNDWSDQFSLVWCVSATPESPERYCGKNTGYTVDEVGGFAVPGDPERAAASWATRNGFDSQSEGRGLRRTSRSGGELVVSDFFILGEGRDASVVSLHRYPGFGEITVEGDIHPMWFVDDEDGSTDLVSLPLTLPYFDLEHSTCLNDDAFRVHAQFATAQGTSGVGRTVELTEDTGYFTFFDEDNVEVVAKVLDACGVNGYRWVFAAGLTSVAVNLIVKSPEGVVREYVNLLQQDFQPILDTMAFECPMAARRSGLETSWFTSAEVQRMSAPPERHRSRPVAASSPASGGACVEDATTHCLSDERFRVTSSFRTANGTDGNAQARPITSDTGYFTFFDEDNVEVVVKVLDACGVNGYRWVFAAGLTNVEVDLDVEDTETGETVSYRNPLRTPFQPILDTSAFVCE